MSLQSQDTAITGGGCPTLGRRRAGASASLHRDPLHCACILSTHGLSVLVSHVLQLDGKRFSEAELLSQT